MLCEIGVYAEDLVVWLRILRVIYNFTYWHENRLAEDE